MNFLHHRISKKGIEKCAEIWQITDVIGSIGEGRKSAGAHR